MLDNNETISVTNTNSLISLAAGAFKVYSNKPASLSTENLFLSDVVVYPNPIKTSFQINMNTKKIIIFDANGKIVKEFLGDFNIDTKFSIKGVEKGFYLLKASNKEGETYQKLIIE